jgi:hypothetical protein
MTGHHHNVDTENRQAIAAGPNMPDKPPRYRSSPPTPSDFVGILPPPLYATYWGYLSQADTHLAGFWMVILLDASVLIEAERGSFDLRQFRDEHSDDGFALSAITASEMLHGVPTKLPQHSGAGCGIALIV